MKRHYFVENDANSYHTRRRAGLLEYYEDGILKFKRDRLCELCEIAPATIFHSSPEIGRIIDNKEKSMHVSLCARCHILALKIQPIAESCKLCVEDLLSKRIYVVRRGVYSVKLPDGTESHALCKEHHLQGGHRDELKAAVLKCRERRLVKSI
jgi:hypothetical protein